MHVDHTVCDITALGVMDRGWDKDFEGQGAVWPMVRGFAFLTELMA